MKLKLILFYFSIIFVTTKCGDFSQINHNESEIANREKEENKDISKSEKTTEKISESVGEKTSEVPKNLLSGFRKSGISSKIKVDENRDVEIFQSSIPSAKQDDLDVELLKAIRSFRSYAVKDILLRGGDLTKIKGLKLNWRQTLSFSSVVVTAILLDYEVSLNPSSLGIGDDDRKFDIRYPFVEGLITPEDVLHFDPQRNPLEFIAKSKNHFEKSLLLDIYFLLHSNYVNFGSATAELLTAIELSDLARGIQALKNGADPIRALKNPSLLHKESSVLFLPHLIAYGVSLNEPINQSGTYWDNLLMNSELLSNFLRLRFNCRYYHELELEGSIDELLQAVKKSDTSGVKKLLEQGVNPNFAYGSGDDLKTLLMTAVESGNWQTIAILLSYGADPSIELKSGKTALTVARRPGTLYPAAKEALLLGLISPSEALNILSAGLPESIIKKQKNEQLGKVASALSDMILSSANEEYFSALKTFDSEKIKEILPHTRGFKSVGIYRAVERKNIEIAKLLLSNGSSPFLQVGNGESAYQLAKKNNLIEFVEEFERWNSLHEDELELRWKL